jgi:hypothetical protein
MRAQSLATALALVVSVLAATSARLHAQTREQVLPGAVNGVVSASDGTPLPDALVRLTRDAFAVTVRAWDDGSFTFPNLAPGDYTLLVRRIGFVSYTHTISVRDARRSLTVKLAPTALDTVRVAASWTGVTGVVGEFSQMRPLAGAAVRLIGSKDTIVTAADGRFAVSLPNGGSFAIRVEERGFAPRLVSVTVPRGQRVEIAVLLDSLQRATIAPYIFAELDKRMRLGSARAGIIGRAEMLQSDSPDLLTALKLSTSPNLRGLTATRHSCVFIDGVAQPGIPADAVRIDEVEFIEMYPAEADYSHTLATRWPPKADCGNVDYRAAGSSALDIQGSDFRRRQDNPYDAKYVLIWTRK